MIILSLCAFFQLQGNDSDGQGMGPQLVGLFVIMMSNIFSATGSLISEKLLKGQVGMPLQ